MSKRRALGRWPRYCTVACHPATSRCEPGARWTRDCSTCTVSFTTGYRRQRFCSKQCRDRRPWAERRSLPSVLERNARRRAAIRAAFVEEVDRAAIFDRDGWVCQLCGDPVDRDLRYPHPLSRSLDHVIPLSLGGAHASWNTQLAHLVCNRRKQARVAA